MMLTLGAAAVAFSTTAKADFCRVPGNTPQEIAANVLKSKAFKRIGGTARFVGYFNQKAILQLIVTKPGHPAHPAVACQRASDRSGTWEVSHSFKCQASRDACNVLLKDFKVLFAQWSRDILKKANSNP